MPGSNILGQCPACCTPRAITWDCVSREGTGYLRGWTNYLGDVSDWNLVKFTRRNQSGSDFTCAGGDAPGGYQEIFSQILSGYITLNPVTNIADLSNAVADRWTAWDFGHDLVCGMVTEEMENASGGPEVGGTESGDVALDGCEEAPVVRTFSDTVGAEGGVQWVLSPRVVTVLDALTRVISGIGLSFEAAFFECELDQPIRITAGGSITLTLEQPDTVAAALARESPVVGSDCDTHPGSIGGTTAGAYGQIEINSGKSSTATVHLPISTPGTYTFVIDLQPYELDWTPLTPEEIEITIEVDAGDIVDGNVDYIYEVPVRTDQRVMFIAARDLAAA